MIAEKTVQEIFEAARIDEVVEDFVNLKKRGSNKIGLCPFHNEKTPSFNVSPSKNIFKCFGCGKGGNAVQFLMEHENFTYPEALKYLAAKYQIKIEEENQTDEQMANRLAQESLYIINEFANAFFQTMLYDTEDGRTIGLSYFKERGYRDSTIKKFQLGYAVNVKDRFTKSALAEGYRLELLKTLGLTTQYDNDFFKGRVMFPIHGLSGKPIAFAGRHLQTEDKRSPKYINSPETPIYSKSKVLYGLFQARNQIRKLDLCYLVEGYTDVISLHQAGIENVVSSSGTSLTKEQIRLIKRYTSHITVLYDGDEAGIKAALRGLDLILAEDMNVKIVLLPDGHDPDSFVQEKGLTLFEEFVTKEAKDFIFFKADLLHHETQHDPIQRTRIIKDIVFSISQIPDPIKRSLYVQECARVLDVQEKLLITEVNHSLIEMEKNRSRQWQRDQYAERRENSVKEEPLNFSQGSEIDAPTPIEKGPDEFQEYDVIRVLINGGHLMVDLDGQNISIADYVLANIQDIEHLINNPLYLKVLKTYREAQSQGSNLTYQNLVSHTDENLRNLAVEILSTPYEYSNWDDNGYPLQTQVAPEKNFLKDSYSSIMRLKLRKIISEIKANQAIIEQMASGNDADKLDRHLKIHKQLIDQRNTVTLEFKNVVIGQ